MTLNDFDFIIIIIIGMVGVFTILTCCTEHHTYMNITSNVIDKYENEYTTIVPISNGRTTSMIPIYNHDYIIVTSDGELNVNHRIYEQYNNGSQINLTKDLNDSSIMYNGV